MHVLPCPDPYRGTHLDGRAAARGAIAEARAAGGELCAFISESVLSCGGQVGGSALARVGMGQSSRVACRQYSAWAHESPATTRTIAPCRVRLRAAVPGDAAVPDAIRIQTPGVPA